MSTTQPSWGSMRRELRQAGWTERNSTTYIDPAGNWYRGPMHAWLEMRRRSTQVDKYPPGSLTTAHIPYRGADQ